jgi:cell wall-associated NlpC family hydrolase
MTLQPANQIERARVVALAREWMNTPYNPNQKVKGAGVDCAMYPLAVYQEAGKIPLEVAVPFYPPDWHMHRDEEKYLNFVREVCELAGGREITPTRLSPGDFVLWKIGRTFRMAPSSSTGRSAFTATFRTASRCSTPTSKRGCMIIRASSSPSGAQAE